MTESIRKLLLGSLALASLAACGGSGSSQSLGVAPPAAVAPAAGTPTISIAPARSLESSLTLAMPVTLSAPTTENVVVNFATQNGSATAGSDYTAVNRTLTILAGETRGFASITLADDAAAEGSETLTVTLSIPTNAQLGTASAIGTIDDDETPVTLRLAPAQAAEGQLGQTTALLFRATLSRRSGELVTAAFATRDGSARAGSDYTAKSGRLSFAPGEIEQTISVGLLPDESVEPDETLQLQLTDPVGASLEFASAAGTVQNDDTARSFSVDDAAASENSGPMVFTVRLSQASGIDRSVRFATVDGTATGGSDYTATSGTLTLAAGAVSATVAVALLDDAAVEPTEALTLQLTAQGDTPVADGTGSGTLLDNDTAPPPPPPPGEPPPAANMDQQVLQDTATFDRCDFINREYCTFPWPNNWFTTADGTTETGRRVNMNPLSMPVNINGKPLDPIEWNRNDGFSPGQAILARVPGLDLVKTGAAPLTDLEASIKPGAPIAVFDLGSSADATPVPTLVWAEMDANLTAQPAASPAINAGPAVIVRPGVNFKYGHRYAVVLRNLKNTAGATLTAPAAFRIYRDKAPSSLPMVEARRAGFEALFAQLAKAGVARSELYLAWDFTVISRRSMTERMVHMRDDALASIGTASPGFVIDDVIDNPIPGRMDTARRIRGHVTVPCYLNTPNCISGGQLNYLPGAQSAGAAASQAIYGDGKPDRIASGTPLAATASVPFTCSIARKTFNGAANPAAATGGTPARPSLYGHGLLGSRDEGNTYDFNVRDMAEEHNFLFCMVDWAGLATGNTPDDPEGDPQKYDPAWDMILQDAPTTVGILQDMSNFPKLTDRGQQGVLNFIVLGKLMLHPQGLCSNAAFKVGNTCLIDRSELFYDGNSQGGIIGGALMAVSPDLKSGVLGVVGMNYSTLLQRSVDFDTYAQVFYNAYPAGLDQQFILSFIQMLWDRSENNGYAQTLAPGQQLPGVPAKRVLLHPAFGDHQVSMTTAEVMARTIGAGVHCPAVVGGPSAQRGPAVQGGGNAEVAAEPAYLMMRGAQLAQPHAQRRHSDDEPYFGLPCVTEGQATGNAFVVWDRGPRIASRDDGVVPPPTDNRPPRPQLGYGGDPHGDPRNDVKGRAQKNEWLKPQGKFIDTCNGKPCTTRGFVP